MNKMKHKWMGIIVCAFCILFGGCSTQKNSLVQAVPQKESTARCMMNEKVADGTISEWASGNTFYYVMFDVRKKHTITVVIKKIKKKLNELNSADGDTIEVRSLIILKQI